MPYRSQHASSLADLIMRQGDIAADRAQRSGDVWANVARGLGSIPAGIQQQRAADQEATQKQQDRELSRRNIDSQIKERAAQIAESIRKGASEDEAKQSAKWTRGTIGVFSEYAQLSPEEQQTAWPSVQQRLATEGGWEPEKIPKASPPIGYVKGQLISHGITDKAFSLVFPEPEKPQIAPSGSGIIVAGKMTEQVPFKAPEPPTPGSFEDYLAAPADRQAQIRDARKGYLQADDRPRVTVQTDSGMSPTMEANVINRLTTQWGKAVAPVAELSRQVKLMDAGMDAVKRGDMAQGSQVILVTFQKILDPPSVVRESEYMRSSAGQSMMNRVKGAYDRLVKGGAGVTVDELQRFASLAREAALAQSTGHVDAVKSRLGKTADRYKIPRDLVFEDFDFSEELKPPADDAQPGDIVYDSNGNQTAR